MSTMRRGNILQATQSLKNAKARSFLTMLGIVIGVMAVICVVCIGQGVKQQIGNRVDHFGKDLITIRPGNNNDSTFGNGVLLASRLSLSTSSLLTTNDLKAVQDTPGVRLSVPLSTLPGSAEGDNRVDSPLVIATGKDLPEAINQKIAFGGFFGDDNHPNIVVLGPNLAQQLFDERVPLGRSLNFHGQNFVVGGIFAPFDAAPFSLSADFNNALFIPFAAAQAIDANALGIYQILAKPDKPSNAQAVAKAMQTNINRERGDSHDVSVLTQSSSLDASNQIVHLLTLLTVGVAAIALVVGGVGIMDVMLVSVTERMHEIGLRKAIGATNQQILRQFMTEALVLSTAGAIIGGLLSLLVIVILRWFTGLHPVVVWQAFVLAMGLAVVTGAVFGTAPALKAARKDPIEALRNQ
ncbi:MAG: ABC transporter permease [Candidatus Saccharimonadales bacterium]